MLFLGAGASSAVDIPDLSGLTVAVNNRLEAAGYGKLIHHITETLKHANQDSRFFNQGEIDIEVIFSILNGRINPDKTLMELGPFAIYLSELGGNQNLPFENTLRNEPDLVEIRRMVGEVIVTNCSNPDMDRARHYYRQLFDFKKEILGHGHDQLFNHIVTTNYDLVIERCARANSDIPRKTGFEQEAGTNEYYLPLRKIFFDEQHANNKINYLKLHGSIDWRIRDSDRQVVLRDFPNSLMGETYTDPLMVYPIYEKYVSVDPYFTLYNYFRRLLYYHDEYVVIGYSFRDQSINYAFADALRNKPHSRIIIANRNRNSIERRINQYFPGDRRHFIDTPFGDDGFITELRSVF